MTFHDVFSFWINIFKCLFSGVIVSQYIQNVTKRLALGAELLYQYGTQVPGKEIAIYTLAGRYSGKETRSTSAT